MCFFLSRSKVRSIFYMMLYCSLILHILTNLKADFDDGERCYNFEIAGCVLKLKRLRLSSCVNFTWDLMIKAAVITYRLERSASYLQDEAVGH